MKSNYSTLSTDQYTSNNSQWFFVTILFIILDYTRLHETLQFAFLRPLLIINIILICFILSSGKIFFFQSKQITWMWIFILLLSCFIPFASNYFRAYITAKTQLVFMPFVLSVIITVDSIERLKKFIFILICIEIYIALYALSHAGYGPGNYFGDENDLALYINMWLPFCYFLLFEDKSRIKRIFCLAGLIVGLLAVVISISRGGFVGIVSMGLMLWVIAEKKVFSTIMILFMVGIVFMYAGEKYWSEMSTATNITQGTGRERIESWSSAWNMFRDNPLGVGGNNFQVRFPEYQTEYFGDRNMWGRVAHSIWFTLIPELGIFGIFIYFILLYYNLKDIFYLRRLLFDDNDQTIKYLNCLGSAFLISLTGYFATGSFISVLYYAHYWYMIGIIIAAVNIAKKTT